MRAKVVRSPIPAPTRARYNTLTQVDDDRRASRGGLRVAGKRQGKKRGPKGGMKHQPGRGHDIKSGPAKRKRFQRKAAKRRQEKAETQRLQWAVWDSLSAEAQKILVHKKPKLPRPQNEP